MIEMKIAVCMAVMEFDVFDAYRDCCRGGM